MKGWLAIVWALLLFGVGCSSTSPGHSAERVATSQAALTGNVTWTNVVGCTTNSADVTKTASDAWGNASATSVQSLSGDGTAQFTTAETSTYKMGGLTHAVSNSSYTTIDYAIFLVADGSVEIFEAGNFIGVFGTYAAGDVFTVQVSGTQVSYLRNGSSLYTSTRAPTLPLFFDAVPYSTGATIDGVTLTASSGGGNVTWTNTVGVSTSGASVTKTASDGWGNASATSVQSLTGDGTAQFTTAEATTYKMAGLTHAVSNSSYTTIDYAIFLVADGSVEIFEDAAMVGTFGTYAAGDVFSIVVSGTQVTYLRNGTVLYASTRAATLPLVFDAAPYSQGATIDDVTLTPNTDGSVLFTSGVGVSISGNNVTKTAADGWGNASATSVQSLGGDGAATFTTAETGTYKMAGLTHAVSNDSYTTIDYAIFLVADGSVEIFEDAMMVGVFGTYAAGDVFTIQVSGTQVSYLRNGSLLTTSSRAPTLPLTFDAAPYSQGATINHVTLKASNGAVTWTNVVGCSTSGASVTKTAADGWGNASATSVQSLTGDGTAQFTTAETTTHKMAGLTHAVTNASYTTIDYAIFLVAGGSVEVFEDASFIGVFGTYAAGDVFTIQVSGAQVTYLRNGTVFYTSTKAPTLPLVFDAVPYSQGATITDVALKASKGGGFSWTNVVGCTTSGASVTKTASDGWGNASATSVQSLSGDGSVQFTTAETTSHKMAGLTHAVSNDSYTTIDYAIFLVADGSVEIFEDASFIGVFGTYAAGDVFSIHVSGTTVSYLRNGKVIHTSANAPTLPLVFDAAPYSQGATIGSVSFGP